MVGLVTVSQVRVWAAVAGIAMRNAIDRTVKAAEMNALCILHLNGNLDSNRFLKRIICSSALKYRFHRRRHLCQSGMENRSLGRLVLLSSALLAEALTLQNLLAAVHAKSDGMRRGGRGFPM